MAELKSGITLNQEAPKSGRANKRGLYLVGAFAALVCSTLTFAAHQVMKKQAKAEIEAQQTRHAEPATDGANAVNKNIDEKTQKDNQGSGSQASGGASSGAGQQPGCYGPGCPGTNPYGYGTGNGQNPYSGYQPGGYYPSVNSYQHPLSPQGINAAWQQGTGLSGVGTDEIATLAALPPKEREAILAKKERESAWDSPMKRSQQQQQPSNTGGGGMPQGMGGNPLAAVTPGGTRQVGGQVVGADGGADNDYLRQNLQESKKRFAGMGGEKTSPILADTGVPQPTYIIRAGWTIPAMLAQRVSSELPGQVRARVAENVYDSPTGKYLLIPQNSLLLGTYNADVAYAQKRLQVNWDRLQRPGNEETIYLNHMGGMSADGTAGMTGHVDNHYKRLIGFALLTSAFSAGVSITQNRSNTYAAPTDSQLAGQAVGQQLGQFGIRTTERNMNIPPTVYGEAGQPIPVSVDQDIIFVAPFQRQKAR